MDASFNHILSLDGLRGLPRLKQLDLAWNQLSHVREETAILRKHAPALLRLDTRHNPWHKVRAEVSDWNWLSTTLVIVLWRTDI